MGTCRYETEGSVRSRDSGSREVRDTGVQGTVVDIKMHQTFESK